MIVAISDHKIISADLVDVVINHEVLNRGSVESNVCIALKHFIYYIMIYSPQSTPQRQSELHFKAAFTH